MDDNFVEGEDYNFGDTMLGHNEDLRNYLNNTYGLGTVTPSPEYGVVYGQGMYDGLNVGDSCMRRYSVSSQNIGEFKYDGSSWYNVNGDVNKNLGCKFDYVHSDVWIGGAKYMVGEFDVNIDKLYHVTHRWDVKNNRTIGYKLVPRDVGEEFKVYRSRGEKVFISEDEAKLYIEDNTPRLFPMSLSTFHIEGTNVCNVETVVNYDYDIDSYIEIINEEGSPSMDISVQCVIAEHRYLCELRDYMLKYYTKDGKRRKGVDIEHVDLDLVAERVGYHGMDGGYVVQFMVEHDYDYYGLDLQYGAGLLLNYPLPTFKTFVEVYTCDGNSVGYLEEFAQKVIVDNSNFSVKVLKDDIDSWISSLTFENYLMENGFGSLQEVDSHTRFIESVKYAEIMTYVLDYADNLLTEVKDCSEDVGLIKTLSHLHINSTMFRDLQDKVKELDDIYSNQIMEVEEKLSKSENQIEVIEAGRSIRDSQVQSMLHIILGIMEGHNSRENLEGRILDGAYDGILDWHSRAVALKLVDRVNYMNQELMEYDDLRLYSDKQVMARENLRKQLDDVIEERNKLMAENKRLLNGKNANAEIDELTDKLRFYQGLLYLSMGVMVLLAFLGL